MANWARENPQLEIVGKLRSGKHPYVEGQYGKCLNKTSHSILFIYYKNILYHCSLLVHGNSHVIGIKNKNVEEIKSITEYLKSICGLKITDNLYKPEIKTSKISIQGFWDPSLKLEGATQGPIKVELKDLWRVRKKEYDAIEIPEDTLEGLHSKSED